MLRKRRLRAHMVLVCTNGFTNFRPLLPTHLDLRLQTQTTVRFALHRRHAAKLRDMPALVCKVSESSSDGMIRACFRQEVS